MTSCLVVDDTKFDRMVLAQCARKLGLDVKAASSAEEALALCLGNIPDCVLIDWEMAGTSGIELLDRLQRVTGQRAKGANAPYILICTSHEHPSFIGHAYVHGVDGYIVKPVSKQKLKQKLMSIGLLKGTAA